MMGYIPLFVAIGFILIPMYYIGEYIIDKLTMQKLFNQYMRASVKEDNFEEINNLFHSMECLDGFFYSYMSNNHNRWKNSYCNDLEYVTSLRFICNFYKLNQKEINKTNINGYYWFNPLNILDH